MKKVFLSVCLITFCLLSNLTAQEQTAPKAAPQFDEWTEDFSGSKLDETKWEKFTFEGGSGGKLEVKNGELQIRSSNRTRAGIRSIQAFSGDKFIAEAHLAKVGEAYPEAGSNASTLGYANLTVLFDGAGRNRIEWIFTSEGTFEAWLIRDGRGERLDNKKLGTKLKNPVMSIARRGDEFLFIINSADGKPEDAQIGLKTNVKNMPKGFRLMLYGYGSSENNWDSARVVVAK